MITFIKIILTSILVSVAIFCGWCIVDEIMARRPKWLRVVFGLFVFLMSIVDILILWFT